MMKLNRYFALLAALVLLVLSGSCGKAARTMQVTQSQADKPAFSIEQTLHRELKAKDGTALVSLIYTRPAAWGSGPAVKSINDYFDAAEQKFIAENDEKRFAWALEGYEVNPFAVETPLEWNELWYVVYQTKDFVSFWAQSRMDQGYNTEYLVTLYACTFDLHTGQQLKLLDFLQPALENIETMAWEARLAAIPEELRADEQKSAPEDLNLANWRCYLGSDGIHLLDSNVMMLQDWDLLLFPSYRADVLRPAFVSPIF